MRLAMIVPGIGLLILVLFIGAEFLTSNPVQHDQDLHRRVLGPRDAPAGRAGRARPQGDHRVGPTAGQHHQRRLHPRGIHADLVHQTPARRPRGYDAQITLRDDQSQAALENFYKMVMKKQGWQIVSTGPADHVTGGLEVLGKKAGSDGFYWEMGAVISPTSFGAGAPSTGATSFSLELIQVQDVD